MKLHTQIILAVITFTAFALYKQNSTSSQVDKSQVISSDETLKAEDLSVKSFPQKSKSQVQDVTVDSTSMLASADQARVPSSQSEKMEASATLELDRDTQEDLGFLYHSEKIERDYLLKKAGLSAEQYEKIQEQRQKVHQQLQKAEAWAQTFGVNPDEAKKPILEKHVIWMQSSIGIGHYQRLQEAISNRLDY